MTASQQLLVVLLAAALVLTALIRYEPAGPPDQQLGGELARAVGIVLTLLVVLGYVAAALWRHARWLP